MHEGIEPVVVTVMADPRATAGPKGHGAAGVQDIAAATRQAGTKAFRGAEFQYIAAAEVSGVAQGVMVLIAPKVPGAAEPARIKGDASARLVVRQLDKANVGGTITVADPPIQ